MDKAIFSKNNPRTNPRLVSLRDMVVFAIAFMAPIAPAFIYGRAAKLSEGSLALGYLIAAAVTVVTVLSYRKLIDAFPAQPSIYTYLSKAVHPLAGFGGAWCFLLVYITGPAAALVFCSRLMKTVAAFDGLPAAVWVVLLALVALGLNFLGTRFVNAGNLVLVAVGVAFTGVFILVGIMAASNGLGVGHVLSAKPFAGTEAGLKAYYFGPALAIGTLVGIEATVSVSADTADSRKNLKTALFAVAIALGVFYLLQAYSSLLAMPDVASMTSATAAKDVSSLAGGAPMVVIYVFGVLAATTAALVAGQAAAARLLERMGEEDALPRGIFATQQRRTGAPIVNHIIIFVVTVALGIAFSSPTTLTELLRFGGLLGFVLINGGAVLYLRGKGEDSSVAEWILPAVGALLCFAFVLSVKPLVLVIGVVWLGLGVLVNLPAVLSAARDRGTSGGPGPARTARRGAEKGRSARRGARKPRIPFMTKDDEALEGVLFEEEGGQSTPGRSSWQEEVLAHGEARGLSTLPREETKKKKYPWEDEEEDEVLSPRKPAAQGRSGSRDPWDESYVPAEDDDEIARKLEEAFNGKEEEALSGGSIISRITSRFGRAGQEDEGEDPFALQGEEPAEDYEAEQTELVYATPQKPQQQEWYEDSPYAPPAFEEPPQPARYEDTAFTPPAYEEPAYVPPSYDDPPRWVTDSEPSIDELLSRQAPISNNTDLLRGLSSVLREEDVSAPPPQPTPWAERPQPAPVRATADSPAWVSVEAPAREDERIVWNTEETPAEKPKREKVEFRWE
jgi:amino acid transporter